MNEFVYVGTSDGALALLAHQPPNGWQAEIVFVHPERSVARVFDRCDLDSNGVDDLVVSWNDSNMTDALTTRWPDGDLSQTPHATEGSIVPGMLGLQRAPVCLPDLDEDGAGEISNAGFFPTEHVPNTTEATRVVDVVDHDGEQLLVVADMGTPNSTFRAITPDGEARFCVRTPSTILEWYDLFIIDSHDGQQAWAFVHRSDETKRREVVAIGPTVLDWIAEQADCVELERIAPEDFESDGGS